MCSSDLNRILLALAAHEGWTIAQSDIVQAFLHGVLDDATLYIHPPARYPCPPNRVLRLQKAVYGLHQAPLKFKKEVVAWFRAQHYVSANAAETIWIRRIPVPNGKDRVLIHAVYADDLLHFYSDEAMFNQFKSDYKQRFEVKSSPADMYLGNRIVVNPIALTVRLDQRHYLEDLRFSPDFPGLVF